MTFKHFAAIAAVALCSLCGVNPTLADGFPEPIGFVYVKGDVDVAALFGITDKSTLDYIALEVERLSPEIELPSLIAVVDSTAFDAMTVSGSDTVICTESVTFNKGMGRYRPGTKLVPWCNYNPFQAQYVN